MQRVVIRLRERVGAQETRNLNVHRRDADVGKWLSWMPPAALPPTSPDIDAMVDGILQHKWAHLRATAKKATGGTPAPPVAAATLPPSYWDDLYDWILDAHVFPPIRALFSLHTPLFHSVAQRLAERQQRPGATTAELATPELRWLALLGVSHKGLHEIKAWFYKYALFNQSDDRYRSWARLLGYDNLYDFVALKVLSRPSFFIVLGNMLCESSARWDGG